jgi:rhamnosyltransferase
MDACKVRGSKVIQYRSKKYILILLELLGITLSFFLAVGIRYVALIGSLGSNLDIRLYITFLGGALILYLILSFVKPYTRPETLSNREVLAATVEHQLVYVAAYIILFYLFPQTFTVSRMVVGLFLLFNIFICSAIRLTYRHYCVKNTREAEEKPRQRTHHEGPQHIYIIGSKSIGLYGGYESFLMNLLQQHAGKPNLKYHIATKANGQGCMELQKMPGAVSVNDVEFTYYGAHCFLIRVPEWTGSAQAIFYDLRALKWACSHIEKNHIPHPSVYILASRIGPSEKRYAMRIRKAGGQLIQNPDGHENWRRKWSSPVRSYWKFSEKYAVKYADVVLCDSRKIEEYIREEYNQYSPVTTFIPYGSDVSGSKLADDDPKYLHWLTDHNLRDGKYVISVGRFVQENNFDIMIREFMRSGVDMDFAIITTENGKYATELQQKYNYKSDPRIKFVGTVYDAELLAKIRENAAAYLHGHEVGGTNPSLLESMGKTKVNLLYDVGFNREVAEDAALYWTKEEGSLAALLDGFADVDADELGRKAKDRMRTAYSWKSVADAYEEVFSC